ncbi:hypothetical protein UMM65_04875 [Aureibaculum sp. 2210JD6-5]|uniref:hypothetical protein n=1 Tax=Aureibaculum sp. 2210JD6-5 TaxID=3103957 RepID=UPI002AAEDCAA|nr:hypothetical protein [Aureibaculum sp. 2210JD6-5]MDY7394563.1 hypothetical protein [Aureibaculum sp. 2210JD6-5]
MKNLLLTILFSIGFNFIYSQTEFSQHSIDFSKNNNKRKVNVSEVSIIVDGIKINGKKLGQAYRFPKIDSSKTFNFFIKTNKMRFNSGPYKAWILNKGSNITLGKITRTDKLLSVAKYNGMEKNEENYEIFSKRFFIPNGFTIDINNHEKIKRLDYLVINPIQKGDGSYVLTKKIVKLKK